MCINEKNVYGEKSYIISNNCIELAITKLGGQMAPVQFYKDDGNPILPYYISPWQEEDLKPIEPVNKVLRGDFFLLPCGLPKQFEKEGYIIHGETANRNWELDSYINKNGITKLSLFMNTKIRTGLVKKIIKLVDGNNAVYIKHILTGYSDSFSFGHHAILNLPESENSVFISTSPIKFGYTHPGNDETFCVNKEYNSLQAGRQFDNIKQVPTVWKNKPFLDCSVHPINTGFTDLIQIYYEKNDGPAWLVAYYPEMNYIWYSLKNSDELPSTVFWMENKGRHYFPWNGRARCLGLEDVCVAFGDDGVNSHIKEKLRKSNIKYEAHIDETTIIRNIQGVAKVPVGFGSIEEIDFSKNTMTVISESKHKINVNVDWEFLFS